MQGENAARNIITDSGQEASTEKEAKDECFSSNGTTTNS